MNRYTYDFELQTMTTMLLNCFSDIVVKRFNVHKQPRDQIKARVVYAPKQRVLSDLLDKDQNLQLPVISVQIGGIARDESRVFNKILGTFSPYPNSTQSVREKGPQPVDITYNVSIMTRYQADMDQILSHLIPYVNPYFVVSWRTPNRPDFEIRSNVYWSGNVNIQYPVEVSANQVARVVADLSFTFKGWIFQNPEFYENVFTFDMSLIATKGKLEDLNIIPREFLLENEERLGYAMEHLIYQGTPPRPSYIEPFFTYVGNFQQFNVAGKGFHKITNVYLSGAPLLSLSTLCNPFSANAKLSAEYPEFFAFQVPELEWSVTEADVVSFVMPSAVQTGFVDVIVESPGGYGKLTEHVRLNTFNPYPSSSPLHELYVAYEAPYLSGIIVQQG